MSLMTELRRRRLLPLLGAYLGGMWLLTELAGYAVARFGLPDRAVDALFLSMWLLLPAALLVVWRVGPPGDAAWRRRDFLLLGANGLAAVAVLALLAPADPAKAPAPAVASGTPAVPPPPARPTRVALFVRSDDAAGRETALALTSLTSSDLAHDPRIATAQVLSSPTLLGRLRRDDRRDPLAAPLGDLRQAALDAHMQGLAVARLSPAAGGLRLEAEFYTLNPERALPPLSETVADAWAAADLLAARIRSHFAAPGREAEANDPPVRAVSTDSAAALADYTAGVAALALDNQPEPALARLQSAWATDPDFALAGYALRAAQSRLGRTGEAEATLRKLLPRMGRLPERFRYALQLEADPDPAAQRRVYEAWLRRAPNETAPRRALALLDLKADPDDAQALATLRRLVLADGEAGSYVQVATVLRRLGRDEETATLAKEGLDRFPGDPNLLAMLAAAQQQLGQPEAAEATLREWSLLRPDQVEPLQALSRLQFNQGRFDAALATLDQAEPMAADPGRRALVQADRIDLLGHLGRDAEALARLPALEASQVAIAGRAQLPYLHHMAHAALYARVHGAGRARAWLEAALDPAADPRMTAYAREAAAMAIAVDQRDAAAMAATAGRVRAALLAFGASAHPGAVMYADVVAADARRLAGDAAGALADLLAIEPRQFAASRRGEVAPPDSGNFLLPAVAAATAAGDGARADAWLAQLERREPGDPRVQLARATRLAAAGDAEGARRHLAPALAAWSQAAPTFPPAQEARALAARLDPG